MSDWVLILGGSTGHGAAVAKKLALEGYGIISFHLDRGEAKKIAQRNIEKVNELTNGERLVCVGWIESYVKSTEERECLFDLDAGARGLLAKYGRSDEVDLIFKSYSNLLRILGN